MKRSFAVTAIVLLGLASTATAADGILGIYEGKVGQVQGFSSQEGQPCTVTVTSSGRIGTVNFQINDIEPVVVEERKVADGMKAGTEVKIINSIPNKGVDILYFAHDAGTLQKVRIIRRHPMEETILCGNLVRKQN